MIYPNTGQCNDVLSKDVFPAASAIHELDSSRDDLGSPPPETAIGGRRGSLLESRATT
jgi:hypothetical protein